MPKDTRLDHSKTTGDPHVRHAKSKLLLWQLALTPNSSCTDLYHYKIQGHNSAMVGRLSSSCRGITACQLHITHC